jgi:hypothetical protein
LQAEGEQISPPEVSQKLEEANRLLETELPQDIRLLYFNEPTASAS